MSADDLPMMPVRAESVDTAGAGRALGWDDGPDAAAEESDIGLLHFRDWNSDRVPDWSLQLLAAPPPASNLDPTQQVIEYGVVIDGDRDLTADCQIGINTDTPKAGDYRVWVTNLDTGVTTEQVGPPYGLPVEFFHPDEEREFDPAASTVAFWFLQGRTQAPCAPFGKITAVYAWASVTEDGQVTAWDYAPDANWLDMPR